MHFTSVSGHLGERSYPMQYQKWELDTIICLFDVESEYNVKNENKNIVKTITDRASRARMLIIWTDCDREGEHIGYEIINQAERFNRNLVIKRAVFSALTRHDIYNAINNLNEPNKNLSDAVDVRQSIDLLLGASFTRFQTLLFKKLFYPNITFEEGRKKFLSYGPCMFPTLHFIVARAELRRNFIIFNIS